MDVRELAEKLLSTPVEGRRIVAIAGAPGSGKSTFSERLRDLLDGRQSGFAEILPMDGFHFDDRVLEARGHRLRKGAPHTFDVDGFTTALERLRRDDGRSVVVPVFDRDIEIARAGARIIGPTARWIVVEGNYLLLDDPDWVALRGLFDVTVMLHVPMSTLEARLERRWSGYGLDATLVRTKLEANDLPNARLVVAQSVPADFEISHDEGTEGGWG